MTATRGSRILAGYAKVSKADGSQTTDLQRDLLIAAGVAPERIYSDHASGKKHDHPGLGECLRSLRHLVNTVDELNTRGVNLKVLTGMKR